jgi:tetratricopeptide (TPR) repeat protein
MSLTMRLLAPNLEELTAINYGSRSSCRVIGSDQGHGQSNSHHLGFSSRIGFAWIENRSMARPLAKSLFVLLALGLWIFACTASQSDDDEFNLLNQQVQTLYKQGKYQEAIPLAEKAVELAKRVYGPEQRNTATRLNNLAELYQAMGDYPKAEPFLQEALRIRQKVLGPEHPDTAASLNNLALLYWATGEYAKAEPLDQEATRPL